MTKKINVNSLSSTLRETDRRTMTKKEQLQKRLTMTKEINNAMTKKINNDKKD